MAQNIDISNKNFRRNFHGYTILETLIYISILVVILVFVLNAVLSLYRAFASSRIERKLSLNGDVAIETIIRDIRATSTASVPNFTTLQLGVETLSLVETKLQKSIGATVQDVTTSDVRVTSLAFYLEATSTPFGDVELVTTRMTLEAGSGDFVRQKNFFGSAVTRGSY